MKTLIILLLVFHGIIHFFGFLQAYKIHGFNKITAPISKTAGILWLTAQLMFLATATILLLDFSWWWLPGIIAVIFSQILLIKWWKDARYGTIANLLIVTAVLISFFTWRFERQYLNDVTEGIKRSFTLKEDLLTENDLNHLPEPLQKYLIYAGALNKPKVHSFRVVFNGEMRSKENDWFSFTSEQYNFLDEKDRLFFMKAKVKNIPAHGYHAYKDGDASMKIKLLSIFPVININSQELLEAETVTLFNDMCLLAPSTLIDKSIRWEEIDPYTVKGIFTHNGITVSAILLFNSEGRLLNFISDDRYDISGSRAEKIRFSTPVKDYNHFNGYYLCTYGEAIWHYPEGEFVYGKFNVRDISYNVK
ncbi:MAG: DUF6544 family protein [Candidatus Cyclobacteriaceae bacterium M2_1C_046]